MAREKMLLHYLRDITYKNDPTNQIGTDADFLALNPDDSPLRVVPTPTGDIAYVRKFGKALAVTACSAIANMADANQKMYVYASDGTLLGTKKGSGAFTAGATVSAQGVYVIVEGDGGAITTDPSVIITLTGKGALTCIFSADAIGNGDDLTYYISDAGSSYYDVLMKYGGARHTPVLGSSVLPYFDITTAYGALAAANNDGVEILDSETYDEDLTTDGQALDSSDTILYSSTGQSPTITRGVGARVTREVSTQYNNTTAIYFNKNGDDADAGTWQEPKLTIAGAIAARVAHNIVYGGTGATVTVTFEENVTIAAAYTLESDYGYTPIISKSTGDLVRFTGISSSINGFTICNSVNRGLSCYNLVTFSGIVQNCTSYNNADGILLSNINTFSGTIKNCIFYNNTNGIYYLTGITLSGTIENCICYNNTNGIYSDANTLSGIVQNCICYNNTTNGIYFLGSTLSGTIENCTSYNNDNGIRVAFTVSFTGAIQDCISYFNTSFDLYKSAGVAVTITESNYLTNSGFTIGAGYITTDPAFCKIINPLKLGISADSGAYRTDTSFDDMGTHFRIIEIDAADIIINGINIDGQDQFNSAIFILDTANHTGLNIKWCNIFDFQGIAIDLYDDGTDLDAIISNNIIKNSGNGIKLAYGGNTLEKNIVFNNSIFGIHSNYTGTIFNHNVFYLNQYGIYLESNSGGITIKNNIFNQDSLYGIYSEVAIAITYCCMTDAINSNVDITSDTNITSNPLFINTNEGEENFNIKTIEDGSLLDSPCKDAGESDIGAYTIDRGVLSDVFKKYEFTHNPIEMNPSIKAKGVVDNESTRGGINLYGKEHKRVFPLNWGGEQLSSKELRLTIALFSKLIQTRKNQYTKEQIRIRYHLRPDTFLATGTSATVDATLKTILDSSKSWIQDQWEGYYVGVKFTKGTGDGDISASGKILTVTGAGWTVDEWEGYYIYTGGYYYIIVSNTSDALTLGDPDGTLTNESSIDWAIEKYFEIKFNTDDTLTVYDENDELVAGSLDYYIDFIIVKVNQKSFSPVAAGIYDFENEELKTGYNLLLEQE